MPTYKVALSEGPSIVAFVIPLIAIMKGQVSHWVITHSFIIHANDAIRNPAHKSLMLETPDAFLPLSTN